MKRLVVVFCAFALAASMHASELKLPNGNVISKLSNGEIWVTLHPNGIPIAFQVTPNMPTKGQFRTSIVENLPESDIVNAPQSEEIQILGDCQSKTFTIWGVLPYDGKWRAGLPETELATGPENVTRRVEVGSPMERVFSIVCKK